MRGVRLESALSGYPVVDKSWVDGLSPCEVPFKGNPELLNRNVAVGCNAYVDKTGASTPHFEGEKYDGFIETKFDEPVKISQ